VHERGFNVFVAHFEILQKLQDILQAQVSDTTKAERGLTDGYKNHHQRICQSPFT
jgi:hypothetical protein